MNIIEAVKSGLPIRRGSWAHDLWFEYPDRPKFGININRKNGEEMVLNTDDIVATDWEIQEEKVTITRGEFRRSMDDIWKECLDLRRAGVEDFKAELDKRLFNDK